MSDEIIYGESKQDGIPTPNNPVDIKSKNIFDSRKIIQQLDEIKRPILVGITQEDYIEYKSLKDQLKQRDEVIDEAIEFIDYHKEYQDVHKQIGINEFEDVTEDILLEKDIEELVKILQKYKGDNK